MSTTITENDVMMTPKQRILEMVVGHIQNVMAELDEAHSKYGKLTRDETIEYKEIKKADRLCSKLEGQKEAFEIITKLIDDELPDIPDILDYAPKSVEATRRAVCNSCPCELHCQAKRNVDLFFTKCPKNKW